MKTTDCVKNFPDWSDLGFCPNNTQNNNIQNITTVDDIKDNERVSLQECYSKRKIISVTPAEIRTDHKGGIEIICFSEEYQTPFIILESEFVPKTVDITDPDPKLYFISHFGRNYDVIITEIDERVYASRVQVLRDIEQKCFFDIANSENFACESCVQARISGVLVNTLFLEVGGVEVKVPKEQIAHTALPDLRKLYKNGDVIKVVILKIELDSDKSSIRHLHVSKRRADEESITALIDYYKPGMIVSGEIFKNVSRGSLVYLKRGLSILAGFSLEFSRPQIGETVLVEITNVNIERKRVYGKLLSRSILSDIMRGKK